MLLMRSHTLAVAAAAVLLALALVAGQSCAFAPLAHQATSSRSCTTPTTTNTQLSAIDPKKEIGVLPPIGFFEYVRLSVCLSLMVVSVVLVYR